MCMTQAQVSYTEMSSLLSLGPRVPSNWWFGVSEHRARTLNLQLVKPFVLSCLQIGLQFVYFSYTNVNLLVYEPSIQVQLSNV